VQTGHLAANFEHLDRLDLHGPPLISLAEMVAV